MSRWRTIRGFVGHQNRRIGDNGPGDGHALLFAAGHLPRIVVHPVFQPHHRKRHLSVFALLFPGERCEVQRQLDVFHGLQHGNQVVELKDEAHRIGAPGGQLRLGQRGNVDVADMNAARVGLVDPRDQIEKRCFAGAGRPHERQKFSRGDVEGNVVEHRHDQAFPVIGFVKIPDFHNRFCLFGHGTSYFRTSPFLNDVVRVFKPALSNGHVGNDRDRSLHFFHFPLIARCSSLIPISPPL